MRAHGGKYRVVLGTLTLRVRENEDKTFDIRVVRRAANASLFSHALVIRPGTVLKLVSPKKEPRYVRAKVFTPRIQYGRMVAGGVLEVF